MPWIARSSVFRADRTDFRGSNEMAPFKRTAMRVFSSCRWIIGYLYLNVIQLALNTLNRLNKEGEALALQDDLTTHPTLALMRRILADAQAKFRVMVEENAATGARLDGELERARGECATLRGELRDVRGALPVVLNNNNGTSNTAAGNSNNNGTGTAANNTTPGVQETTEVAVQQQQSQDDGKRLSASSSPVEKRSSASDKSASPIEKRTSPVDRKERTSPIDRRASPIEKRNGSPSRSPSEKARRPYAPALEKTRLGGSGGSVDSRSGSASPDRGSSNRGGFLHRGGSDRSSGERLRISTNNRESLRSSKEMNDHEKDIDKDLVDGEVRAEEDNEPPGPAPGSRPSSPANSLGIGDPLVASRLSNIHGGGSNGSVELASTRRLRLENERLVAEVARLRRLLFSGAARGEVGSEDAALEEEARFVALEMELQHAKEALQALKADRKRLKAEKFDLLNQMKALYGTLEDKERELRDFIRNYEQRMRENEATLGRLQQQGVGIPSEERERERERERWSLLRAARDEADRSLSLAASLADKEAALSHAHATIKELQRQLAERGGGGGICLSDQESLVSFPRGSVNGAATPGAGSSSGGGGCGIIPHMNSQPPLGSTELGVTVGNVGNAAGAGSSGGQAGDRGSCSADSGVRGSSDRESGGATSVGGNLSDSTTDATTPKDCSPTLSPLNAFSRSMDNSSLSRSVEQLSSPLESEPRRSKQNTPMAAPAAHSRSSATRGGTWGSISRVFARARHRKATNNSSGGSESNEGSDGFDPYRSWSPLTEEGYAEKLRLLREAASVPMERWRAPTVLAWLEVALGMPQYGPRCAENVKSGKVLLELSDAELEAGLGVTHPLHRKKLRLAIEEHRHPSLVRYPCIAQLGHTWVSSEWLPDLGLAQYSESFATNMVDARMLDHLSKKELEKLLGVTRKFHQASIVHGIHLLRMLNYDRQALAVRRHQCEQVDTDPLVWTNQRFIRWARNIDLTEYAENLKDSGVHGALVVLEPSFTGDTMATALGIPPAKHMIRRHLTAELEALVVPARSQLEVVPRNSAGGGRPMSTVSAGGSLGRGSRALHLQHHQSSLSALHMTANHTGTVDRRRSSLRTCSLLYLKKLSWKSSQGSLSRALGLRPRSEKASPSSSSDTGSLASQYMSSARSNSPPPPQLPPRPITGNKRHRRVKSIGDIDYITSAAVSTPV
ncbi:liprin protein kazrin isoform X7 [Nomia melanderi]|uniref:liprin protein kazrin isoform X7 n=1 Tax=Nomia melanderi TaxID=2448451 RepID=UPI001304083A|nr:kazrin isoform X8 [Nomia melanderi]